MLKEEINMSHDNVFTSAEDVLNIWLAYLNEISPAERYASANRVEHIERLITLLKTYNISYEDAKFLSKKVVESLVTKKGLANSGRYKGWKDIVKRDYEIYLAKYYLEDQNIIQLNKVEADLSDDKFFEVSKIFKQEDIDNQIYDWVIKKYKHNVFYEPTLEVGSIFWHKWFLDYFS